MNLLNTVKLSTLFALPFALAASAQALTFDFGNTSAYGSDLTTALARAGNNWSSRITDNITVKIDFSLANLGTGILGGASPFSSPVSYSAYRTALSNDALSTTDASAVASLAPGSTYTVAGNGLDSQSPIDYYLLDLNAVRLSTANGHAMGLFSNYTGPDANMRLSNTVPYDFNPDNGITAGAFDFVGIVTHELGHALGFFSGVDTLEQTFRSNGVLTANNYNANVTSLDLFRYAEFDTEAYRDLGLGDFDKFLSVDGGVTFGPQFSTGRFYGDGGQASHWKDDLDLGIMDPTANADGTLNPISRNDLLAFDAIGYDLRVAPVPEPASFVALGGALVVLARRRRR